MDNVSTRRFPFRRFVGMLVEMSLRPSEDYPMSVSFFGLCVRRWLLPFAGVLLVALTTIVAAAAAEKEEPARLKAPFTEKEAKEAQTAWAKYLGRKAEEEIDLGDGVKLVLVLI